MPRTAVTPWASTGTRGYREWTEGKGWQAARLLPHEAAAAAHHPPGPFKLATEALDQLEQHNLGIRRKLTAVHSGRLRAYILVKAFVLGQRAQTRAKRGELLGGAQHRAPV